MKYAITLNYGDRLEDTVAKLEFVPSDLNPLMKVLEGQLDQYIIAPAVLVREDGSKEVVGWSLIHGKSYKYPAEVSE